MFKSFLVNRARVFSKISYDKYASFPSDASIHQQVAKYDVSYSDISSINTSSIHFPINQCSLNTSTDKVVENFKTIESPETSFKIPFAVKSVRNLAPNLFDSVVNYSEPSTPKCNANHTPFKRKTLKSTQKDETFTVSISDCSLNQSSPRTEQRFIRNRRTKPKVNVEDNTFYSDLDSTSNGSKLSNTNDSPLTKKPKKSIFINYKRKKLAADPATFERSAFDSSQSNLESPGNSSNLDSTQALYNKQEKEGGLSKENYENIKIKNKKEKMTSCVPRFLTRSRGRILQEFEKNSFDNVMNDSDSCTYSSLNNIESHNSPLSKIDTLLAEPNQRASRIGHDDSSISKSARTPPFARTRQTHEVDAALFQSDLELSDISVTRSRELSQLVDNTCADQSLHSQSDYNNSCGLGIMMANDNGAKKNIDLRFLKSRDKQDKDDSNIFESDLEASEKSIQHSLSDLLRLDNNKATYDSLSNAAKESRITDGLNKSQDIEHNSIDNICIEVNRDSSLQYTCDVMSFEAPKDVDGKVSEISLVGTVCNLSTLQDKVDHSSDCHNNKATSDSLSNTAKESRITDGLNKSQDIEHNSIENICIEVNRDSSLQYTCDVMSFEAPKDVDGKVSESLLVGTVCNLSKLQDKVDHSSDCHMSDNNDDKCDDLTSGNGIIISSISSKNTSLLANLPISPQDKVNQSPNFIHVDLQRENLNTSEVGPNRSTCLTAERPSSNAAFLCQKGKGKRVSFKIDDKLYNHSSVSSINTEFLKDPTETENCGENNSSTSLDPLVYDCPSEVLNSESAFIDIHASRSRNTGSSVNTNSDLSTSNQVKDQSELNYSKFGDTDSVVAEDVDENTNRLECVEDDNDTGHGKNNTSDYEDASNCEDEDLNGLPLLENDKTGFQEKSISITAKSLQKTIENGLPLLENDKTGFQEKSISITAKSLQKTIENGLPLLENDNTGFQEKSISITAKSLHKTIEHSINRGGKKSLQKNIEHALDKGGKVQNVTNEYGTCHDKEESCAEECETDETEPSRCYNSISESEGIDICQDLDENTNNTPQVHQGQNFYQQYNSFLKDKAVNSPSTIAQTGPQAKTSRTTFKKPRLGKLSKAQAKNILDKVPFSELKKRKASASDANTEQVLHNEIEASLRKRKKQQTTVIKPNTGKLKRPKQWVTPAMYEFIINKLKPRYGFHSRVRAEKLVIHMVEQVGKVLKIKDLSFYTIVEEMKKELASLGIIESHFDCREFIMTHFDAPFSHKVYPFDGDVWNPYEPENMFERVLLED